VVEGLRVFEGLPEALAVFYVTREVAYPRVEYVMKSITPEEEIADNPKTFPDDGVSPQPSQVSNRVDNPFLSSHPSHEFLKGNSVLDKKGFYLGFVLFDEGYDALPKVLGNVFSLVFEPSLDSFAKTGFFLVFLVCAVGCRAVGEGKIFLLNIHSIEYVGAVLDGGVVILYFEDIGFVDG
jgi:hypothetical protein